MLQEDTWQGHAPSVLIQPAPKKEDPGHYAEVYRKLWEEHPKYRMSSPGEDYVMLFLAVAKPPVGAEVIDFGCGTGREGLGLAIWGKLKVTMLDFASNCLDEDVAQACVTQADTLSFKVADLAEAIPAVASYGYCCDVMEHIPEEQVPKVLANILASSSHCFFAISMVSDIHGQKMVGEDLHLTVRPMSWWLKQLQDLGAVVHWAQDDVRNDGCFIYCSNWKDADDLFTAGKVNTELEVLNEQVRQNVEAGWKHAEPFDRQDREVIILAGGPSLPKHLAEIRKLRDEEGAALITTNGSYAWALQHGLSPSMQIVLDAREFNSRFVHPVIPKCLYYASSQVHPKTLEALPRDRTFLWHCGLSDENDALVRNKLGHCFYIPGGSTVILRAIPLLRMLGFWRMHLFGFDSCVDKNQMRWRIRNTDSKQWVLDGESKQPLEYETKEQATIILQELVEEFGVKEHEVEAVVAHHAYQQTENDEEPLFPLECGGVNFFCTPWMVSQAAEFRGLVRSLGDEVELAVYGDGLIAQMVKMGASFSTVEE